MHFQKQSLICKSLPDNGGTLVPALHDIVASPFFPGIANTLLPDVLVHFSP